MDSKASTDNNKSETNNDKVLNEIKTWVTAHNAKLYAQMINANNK